MTKGKRTRVKEPVLTVQHDKHHTTSVFVLVSEDETFQHGDTEHNGPAPIVVVKLGVEEKVNRYTLRDVRPWRWLGTLAKAGVWALSNKQTAPLLPDDLVKVSPRFQGTTEEQRQGMAERLPDAAKKSPKAKKPKRK